MTRRPDSVIPGPDMVIGGMLLTLLIVLLACWPATAQQGVETAPTPPPASPLPSPSPAALPSPLGRIGEISVDGNSYTQEDVIRRTAGLQPGEELSPARLRWALDNMNRRRLWAGFTVLTRPGAAAGTTDVRLRVLERPSFPSFLPGSTQIVPSYDGLILREDNVMGSGNSLLFRGRWLGARMVRLDGTLNNLFGSSLFAAATGFYYKKDKRDARVSFRPYAQYDERRIGADLVAGMQFSPNTRFGIDGRWMQEDAWVVSGFVPDHHEPNYSLNAFFVQDTRSAIFNATSGHVLRLGGEFHFAPSTYQRYSLDTAYYLPMGANQLVGRLFAGTASGNVPYYDLWRMGGVLTDDLYEFDYRAQYALFGSVLRAFQEGGLSGEHALNASVEFRVPLYTMDIQGIPLEFGGVFSVDVANAWRQGQPFALDQTFYSLGVGLRINTPFATLRGDFGWHPESQAFSFGAEQVF